MPDPLDVLVEMRDSLRSMPETLASLLRTQMPAAPLAKTETQSKPAAAEKAPDGDALKEIVKRLDSWNPPAAPSVQPTPTKQVDSPVSKFQDARQYPALPPTVVGDSTRHDLSSVELPAVKTQTFTPSYPPAAKPDPMGVSPLPPAERREGPSVSLPQIQRPEPHMPVYPPAAPSVQDHMPKGAAAPTPQPAVPTTAYPEVNRQQPLAPMGGGQASESAMDTAAGLKSAIESLTSAIKDMMGSMRSSGGGSGSSGATERYTAPPRNTRQSSPSTYSPVIFGKGGAKVSPDMARNVSKMMGGF